MGIEIRPLHPSDGGTNHFTQEDIANSIIEEGELPLFAREHPASGMTYLDSDLIAFHYQVPNNKAEKAKKLLSVHVSDSELDEAVEEEWDPST